MSEKQPVHIYDALKAAALKAAALERREPGDERPLDINEMFDVIFNTPRRTASSGARMNIGYDSSLITPAQAVLLLDALPFILHGYQPRPGQTRIEHAELLTLARGVPSEALSVLERSGAWVDLEAK